MPRIVIAVWIYLCGLVGAVTTGTFLARVLSMYPRPVEPAVSVAFANMVANAPTWLWGSAALSAALGIYLWRSRRPLETRLFAAAVIAALNLFLAMYFSVALVVSYFYLPNLASGGA
ncbi:hypothetical protein [Noviluteimonas gilva]|uniref:Uncharacterized protein n=1 Tax=Noviluteimonas gilva TaxID=2682097 RepID=A0A7C9M1S9_9GAMM|nr:hypothetical protein [Lysobacter gilvus]MUV14568.1 hypothetical protein [Lysobacter gilvus]